jgi:hypothetical protein
MLDDLSGLPPGSHCLSFHTDGEEAATNAVQFVAGAPPGQPVRYWVPDAALQSYYQQKLATEAPEQVGCVQVLDHEQVRPVEGKLRPVEEVLQFVGAHPEGVTAAGETLSRYWTPATVPEHLEYEAWFEEQPRGRSRFLCPYDLRRVPPEHAPETLRDLGAHHSHVVLSSSSAPAVRLLQLFVFGTPAALPPGLTDTYRWAVGEQLVEAGSPFEEMTIANAGTELVRAWSESTSVDR